MVRKLKNRRRAFSLMELMLVVAIMGILMAVVGYNMIGSGDRARTRATEATLKIVKNALEDYNLNYQGWPPDLQTLITVKTLQDQKLVDGWGSALIYDPRSVSESQPYQLGSAGKDKNAGSADDISVWNLNR